MFGLCLPSHQIKIVKDDGTEESISCTDCSTKKQVREEAGDLIVRAIEYQVKHRKTDFENWKAVKYVSDKTGEVIYECTVEECLQEVNYR